MRYLFFLFLIVSCSKSLEERCFITGDEKYFNSNEEPKAFTVKDILENKPYYLEIVNLKNFRSFKKDSLEAVNLYNTLEKSEKYWKDQKTLFSDFDEKFFGQFLYSFKQIEGNMKYALGRNGLGYWLLEIKNDKPSAYFLGLSFSHYQFNKLQHNPIVKDGYFQLEGSFVKIVKVPGLPGYDDYSAIEDGKLFKIKLEDLVKDSDHDGYNDIFEKSFGLNPNNKDTDGDGMVDFNDLNPMFKSEKNKFTQLYETLLPDYGSENLSNKNYYFEIFISDCDYFHQISPKYHVLFSPEDSKSKTDYLKVTDVSSHGIGKIKRNKNNPNIFYIKEWGNSSMTYYSAEYKDGQWILEIGGGYVI
ncbi:hypothetical protein [Chryseobacterium indoltheticum]|uniref:hypothetical protein n=1 Tax=Chryseobacterium indoltheticum TaxID=254 RepID=UPI001913630F|nr:hypothetical protein [Chryseobacterium indoltheticum]QQQ28452.1 hypothetical protein JJL46_00095 [Chryseobacterium indoltheticum]